MKYISPTIELEYLESSGDLMALLDSSESYNTYGQQQSFWEGQEGQE